jgi:glutamine amidotransferase PdxT
VLARHGGDPVVVCQGRVIGATFHPDLLGATGLHALLVEAATAPRVAAGG